ncbi:unnamed protein product [Bursaphelenchus okinawaensis]|uniref:Amidase domain-containing protein n=1 Tax=Bursaphelenchus okinawaensis TaxID=465554 RepID=A0A811LQK8_9BILA|nr:unnamed protein product [Bursaphelenchus okinawaensis]CAG9127338.1 unnamed protein product [Bursaphelenchus okinawaensis]
MASENLIPKNDEEKLPKLPIKKIDPSGFLLNTALNGIAKYASSRAKRTVVTPSEEPLLNISATKAAEQIRSGTLKSVDLIQAYYKRIRDVNPFINAATELFEAEAIDKAREVDELIEKKKGKKDKLEKLKSEQPLLGVPVSIKHHFNIKGHRNICGLTHLRSTPVAKANAVAVDKLIAAGAIPICYTNIPPGCLCIESDNAVFGRTCSPHDSRTTCGGSSGGEGALIAAQGSLIGLGTDLGGSIRIPAMLNGVYGLKPGPKGCEFDGVILELKYPEEYCGMAVVGPLARYAEDLALLNNILSSAPILEAFPPLQPTKIFSCAPDAPPLLRLNKEVKHIWEDVRNYLSGTYGTPNNEFKFGKDLIEFPEILTIVGMEGFNINDFLSPNEHISPLKEIVKLLTGSSQLSYGAISGMHVFSKKHRESVVKEAKRQMQVLRQRIWQQLEDNAILLFPSLPESHYFHASAGLNPTCYTIPFNILGLPTVAVPCGRDRLGYPLAVQVAGAPGSELLLCSVAQKIEEKFGGWVQPHGVKFEEE